MVCSTEFDHHLSEVEKMTMAKSWLNLTRRIHTFSGNIGYRYVFPSISVTSIQLIYSKLYVNYSRNRTLWLSPVICRHLHENLDALSQYDYEWYIDQTSPEHNQANVRSNLVAVDDTPRLSSLTLLSIYSHADPIYSSNTFTPSYLSWAMIVKQTCFCFFIMARSKNVSPSVFDRNWADFDKSKSTHSAWPFDAAQCSGVIPRRFVKLIRWAWACRIVCTTDRWPLAVASCSGVLPS